MIITARRIVQKALRVAKQKQKRRAAARARRITTKDVMESLGMKRVRVDGKTFYE